MGETNENKGLTSEQQRKIAANNHYRNICKYNEEYMQPILDNLYRMLDIHTERVYDVNRQTRGADVIFKNGDEVMVLDEKVSTSKPLYVPNGIDPQELAKASRDSYGMELSSLDRKDERKPGWFHPAERDKALNTGYIIVWGNADKEMMEGPDEGKLRKVSQLEICVVPYDKLLAVVDKALAGQTVDEKVAEICARVERAGAQDEKRIFSDCPLASKGVRFSYSGQLKGKPINCMIPKDMLREMSFINYAFNLGGELGREGFDEFKNLKDDRPDGKFRPIKELRSDVKKNPVGFPKPHYLSLEDKKERIFAQMSLPTRAFSMFVPHNYIKEHSLDFIRYAETSEQALRKMIEHCIDKTGMANDKYFPIVANLTPEQADDLSPRKKREMLVEAVLKDHDKLSDHYTIKALENWGYPADMILKASCTILPNNLVGLEERINHAANYIEKLNSRGRNVKAYNPNKVNSERESKDFKRIKDEEPKR
jgi:hypothetical protein